MNTQNRKDIADTDETHSSAATKSTLSHALVHESWSSGFRTSANDKFFARAFERILSIVGASSGDKFLDAGCGSATKTLILARFGMQVTSIDFSDYILDKARIAVSQAGLSDRVEFLQEDLLSLRFEDGRFPNVLCWGVVMHIPDFGRALDELARVTKSGGYVIMSEGNMHSLQALLLRGLKRLLGRERAEIVSGNIGLEFWEETDSGRLMTRQTDISALIKEMERRGMHLEKRFAGQFTELYTVIKNPVLQKMIHLLNALWFSLVRTGRLAYGNILIFRK